MSNLQAFFLGVMVFLTPSLLVVACWLLWLPRANEVATDPTQEAEPQGRRRSADN
jgi:hypothetical protein